MDSESMVVAALGRPFTLGMLYDARKDEIVPGFTLWEDETLQENIVESPQKGSAFEVSASDSFESKSSLLDIEASLKASFLGGLIEVGGSAKYLNDRKKSKNQSRVTFQYKATTTFKQLSLSPLERNTIQKLDDGVMSLATHVVTGILYGANAFFVFDSEKVEASDVQNIQGHMEAVIKKVPSFNVEGSVDINLTEEEKALTDKFSCKFHGDFILESNPATFKDAVKTYVELPQLLVEKSENSVPLKVWLMPLKSFLSEAPALISEISVGLVRKIEDALEDVSQMKIRCNDCLADGVVHVLPQLQTDLNRFQKLCNYYTSNVQQMLMKKLPDIRAGKEDESSLQQFFEGRNESPFSQEKLNKWMGCKEREVNVISSCVKIMEGTRIVPNQSELDKVVLDPDVLQVLCFVFTSLESDDAFLDEMTNNLDFKKLRSTSKVPWYFSNDTLSKMRRKARTFQDYANKPVSFKTIHFLVAAIANETYTGATVYHYKDGILVSEDFSESDLPAVETITNRSDLLLYACDLHVDPVTLNGRLILSEGNKKVSYSAHSGFFVNNPERFSGHPQCLCKEGLSRRSYWEVECVDEQMDGFYILIGVAYIGIDRRMTHSMELSPLCWCLRKQSGYKQGIEFVAANTVLTCAPPYHRIGVYVDWSGGTLSFYSVSSNTLTHLYTYHKQFTEPVYPALGVAYAAVDLRFPAEK